MKRPLSSCVVFVAVLCCAAPALASFVPVSIDLTDGLSSADLFSWVGDVDPGSLDFAGGTWSLTATASSSDWAQQTDGTFYWWALSVPGTFQVNLGSDFLTGTGTFSAIVYSADDTYTSLDPFGINTISVPVNTGVFTSGQLSGQPPVIGGSFSLAATPIANLTVDGGVPVADVGGATFDPMFPPPQGQLTGDVELSNAVPEPGTCALFVCGVGLLTRMRRRGKA